MFIVETKVHINFVFEFVPAQEYCSIGLPKSEKKNATLSVYDCTVEDVEYICNKFSLSVTHSRHVVVIILRCCARRAILSL